jgi:hypothetical protein
MSRYIVRIAFVVFVLLGGALVPAAVSTAHAANLACSASPASGPPGTLFELSASGFTPNTHLWTYAVEPDGTAFSDQGNQGFGGGVKSDASGTASFTFATRFEALGVLPAARALGQWTLVVQQLGLGGAIVNEAHCVVNITSASAVLTGATLAVNPPQGFSDSIFVVNGFGFAPEEIVNVWLTPPPDCSGFAYHLSGFFAINSAVDAFAFTSEKADSSGAISFPIFANTPFFCTGEWFVSARAPGSGNAGSASFLVTGHPVSPGGATLTVNPSVGLSRGGVFTFTGSGYFPGEVVNCWYTRPEGTTREFLNHIADAAGQFELVLVTGFDDVGMQYSEGSLGQYAMTCKGQTSGFIGITSFTLIGGITDP